MNDRDEHIYCDAIERCMMEPELLPGISKTTTAKFGKNLDALRNKSMVNSRHAAIIYWEGTVCALRKSGPVLRHLDWNDQPPTSGSC